MICTHMKKCTLCKRKKPLTEFNKNSNRKDGLQNICRTCSRNKSAKFYKTNRDDHRAYVYQRREEMKSFVRDLKSKTKCKLCNESHIAVLDFHHVDPSTKKATVSAAVCLLGWSKDKVLEEIKKCIVLCANCHRKTEWEKIYASVR